MSFANRNRRPAAARPTCAPAVTAPISASHPAPHPGAVFLGLFLGLAALIVAATPVRAAPVDIPSGECALIVASRRGMDEVRQFIRTEPDAAGRTPRVYLSENGWHAISRGFLSLREAPAVIRRAKRRGLIPQDAYCSTGQVYTARVPLEARAERPSGQRSDQRPTTAPRDARSDPTLAAPFDARGLSQGDKRALQAALALAGDYTGLLDGLWGNGSQSALDAFSQRRLGREPRMQDAVALAAAARLRLRSGGWRIARADGTGLSVAMPTDRIRRAATTGEGLARGWEDPATGISYLFGELAGSDLREVHDRFAEMARGRGADQAEPYFLRQPDRRVSSGTLGNGIFYVRSDRRSGGWGTVAVFGPLSAKAEMGLIASSIRAGGAASLTAPPGGRLSRLIDRWTRLGNRAGAQGLLPPAPTPPVGANGTRSGANTTGTTGATDTTGTAARERAPDPAPRTSGSGSGFLVNAQGIYLTNAHVVEGCRALALDGAPARLVAQSAVFDLAAVEAITPVAGARPLPFSDRPVGLNADITIAGYPLHGLLGGLNVQRGSVAGLKGPGGDDRLIQISAPVQAGNSGGPVIDARGAVVGVVVAKLDARRVADAVGDVPQNVNFAIRGTVARSFLDANAIAHDRLRPGSLGTEPGQTRAEAATALSAATALLECLP